jgi:hypothetical protein
MMKTLKIKFFISFQIKWVLPMDSVRKNAKTKEELYRRQCMYQQVY